MTAKAIFERLKGLRRNDLQRLPVKDSARAIAIASNSFAAVSDTDFCLSAPAANKIFAFLRRRQTSPPPAVLSPEDLLRSLTKNEQDALCQAFDPG